VRFDELVEQCLLWLVALVDSFAAVIPGTVKLTLVAADDSPDKYPGEVIQSPTKRGIVLLRASAIGDRSSQQAALAASSCRSL